MTKKTKSFVIGFVGVLLLAILATFLYIQNIISTGFEIEKTVYIKIDESKDYNNILAQISDSAKVKDLGKFKQLADFLDYPSNIRSGRYAIHPDMNILEAVRSLKSGVQTPVKLKFNNIRTKEDLANRISQQLMITNNDILIALNDSAICANYGFTTETIVGMFIPNTYEVYWNVPLNKFLDRMSTEYKKFWNSERLEKAKQIELTPVEVSILAAIVEEECSYSDEYPIVAGLYINRLNSGQMLQADPTVKFALNDFSLKRILKIHTDIDSPYNTYKNTGLTPGPIRIPSIKAIDAVLSYAKHDYIYMCAKEDFSGRHNFTRTYAEHQRNAAKYHAALNKRRIYQ